nr:D-arabinono-1,4-lactone oxidase [Leekyejoonella antrihumi]
MTTNTNWAGNITYGASTFARPRSLDELRHVVTGGRRVRPLGSRHSFNTIADTDGVLISTVGLPGDIQIDTAARQVSVGGGVTYGVLAPVLQAQGWALANLASLPHISVAGAVSTGTHGSGDGNQSLAAAVAGIDLMGPDGVIRTLSRGDADFVGSVVGLGALGIITRLVLDIEPTFDLWQAVYTGMPWSTVLDDYDAITRDHYSVSIFTTWQHDEVDQVWLKDRDGAPPAELLGATRSGIPLHMLRDADTAAITDQTGDRGPWAQRLPHFRLEFTPSRGEELQSEYLVPRAVARDALQALRVLGSSMREVLQVAEIRSIAADDLWLSPAYGADVVAVHFTWLREPAAVESVLHPIEDALLPMGARPHWGKVFVAHAEQLARSYPRWRDFAELRERVDPQHVFGNAWLDRILPG